MKLHQARTVFWLESRFDEKDVPKNAGFRWHGGNCRPGCAACAAELGKVWWTDRLDTAQKLGEHATDAKVRKALGLGAGPSVVDIKNANLRLALARSLMLKKNTVDLKKLQKALPPELDDDDDPAYVFNRRLANRLIADPITTAQLAKLRKLEWPYEVEHILYPQWDGEDDVFDIDSLDGIEHCTALESIALQHCVFDTLAPLAALTSLKSIWLDGYTPLVTLAPLGKLVELRELALYGLQVNDLSPLLGLPHLKSLRLSWGYQPPGTKDLEDRSQALVDQVSQRKGSKVDISWPFTKPKPRAPRKSVPKPVSTPACDPAQEARICANPDDDDAIAVYGDWLQAEGDPRGVLVAMDRQPSDDKDAARARKAHLTAHRKYLLGKFAAFPYQDMVELTWKNGFIRTATLPQASTNTDSGEVLKALLALSTARFLDELVMDNQFFDDGDDAALRLLIEAPYHPPLRVLRLGAGAFFGDDPAPADIGDLSALWSCYPRLRSLALVGEGSLGKIDLPHAVDVAFDSADLPQAMLQSVMNATWPSLERLSLRFGDALYRGYRDFVPLLDGKRFPRLRHLVLHAAPDIDVLVGPLGQSALLPRLKTLDLSAGNLCSDGAEDILAHAEAYAHLELLDLTGNDITAAQKRALKKVCAKVKI